MEDAPVPDDVRRFIVQCIPSVPYLEAILLLKNDASTAWSAERLARRLYVGGAQAAQLLAQMQAVGIVAPPTEADAFRYAPASPDVGDMLERVEAAYRRHLIDITKLIHMKGKAQVFADAFIWRKES